MNKVIYAVFDPEFKMQVFNSIKYNGGPARQKKLLIEAGYHPSFVRALIRNITRNMGW